MDRAALDNVFIAVHLTAGDHIQRTEGSEIDDVLGTARERARREKKTAGAVVSELSRRALTAPPQDVRTQVTAAMRCADGHGSMLHLHETIATAAKRPHGLGFSTRVGLNSGAVVIGAIGDDLRMQYTAPGHTVGLAQRRESLAEPTAWPT